jgi:hypothetical protein
MAKKAINPYDFQNPVGRPQAFAGRAKALSDIRYYLDQATETRPTNLAIIGSRASGKTSLLNMISHDAIERNIVVVRINFDASHARSQLTFFAKIFDALISEVVKHNRPNGDGNCFGGRGGSLMRQYADCMVGSQSTDWENSELNFPNFYAKAVARDNFEAPIPQNFISDDFDVITTEVGRPIALVMDECNVIVENQSILQAMRHMFQGLEKYMLVLTGTEELFPMIDNIYSPVGRGFKRLEVGCFTKTNETYECMKLPCTTLGISIDALASFAPEKGMPEDFTTPDLADLHAFTGGNPHEIQLACHFMFREMHSSGSNQMTLNAAVIESVLQELAPDEERRKTLLKIQNLDLETLSSLCLLSRWGFDFNKDTYHAFVETDRFCGWSSLTIPDFDSGLAELLGMNWLEEGTVGYKCLLQPLERILIKYVAKSKKIIVGSLDETANVFGAGLNTSRVAGKLPQYFENDFAKSCADHIWIKSLGIDKAGTVLEESFHKLDLGIIGKDVRMIQYELLVKGDVEFYRRLVVGVSLTQINEFDKLFLRGQEQFKKLNNLTATYGVEWKQQVTQRTFDREWGLRESDWSDFVKDPKMFRSKLLGRIFHERMCEAFLSDKNIDFIRSALCEILKHSSVPFIDPGFSPNYGFMALAMGLPGTRTYLDCITEYFDGPLVRYNQALARLLTSTIQIENVIAELINIDTPTETENSYRALVDLELDGNKLKFVLWKPKSEDKKDKNSVILRAHLEGSIKVLEAAKLLGASLRIGPPAIVVESKSIGD